MYPIYVCIVYTIQTSHKANYDRWTEKATYRGTSSALPENTPRLKASQIILCIQPPGKYPWIAAVVFENSKIIGDPAMCGATLIASQWAITAGHCKKLENDDILIITAIVLGLHDLNTNKGYVFYCTYLHNMVDNPQ